MDQDTLLGEGGTDQPLGSRMRETVSDLPSRRVRRARHLGQCLHVDDVDEAEEEGHLRGHLGYVGKQAALGQDLGNWGERSRGVTAGLWLRPRDTPLRLLARPPLGS